MRWESKPQPRFGGMEQDATFGGDRWDGGVSDSYGTSFSAAPRPARPAGGYSSGSAWSGGSVPRRETAAPAHRSAAAARSGGTSALLMQLQKGDMVEHTAFGRGMVLSVRPMGGDALAEVAFDKVGAKKLMLRSAGAHMKKL